MKTLDLNRMENLQGGDVECDGMSAALGGAATIFGAASWWSGVGAGISVVLGVASLVAYAAGC
ncbi:hypothetical protein [Leptobacterium sp. I13]|uniref:hypothetical protein n=1 Tax=Leptobacterium meishanense TaxID=3128904 RepID=UPI0030EDED81